MRPRARGAPEGRPDVPVLHMPRARVERRQRATVSIREADPKNSDSEALLLIRLRCGVASNAVTRSVITAGGSSAVPGAQVPDRRWAWWQVGVWVQIAARSRRRPVARRARH